MQHNETERKRVFRGTCYPQSLRMVHHKGAHS